MATTDPILTDAARPVLHVAFETDRRRPDAPVTVHAYEHGAVTTLCARQVDRLEWLVYDSVDFEETKANDRCRACEVLASSEV